jgi:2-oxoglutarate ferredoxin oxidoreductase subunit gamma
MHLEFELYICGIGGQGIQLLAKALALAALSEGRHVMLTGEYGSLMRGGSSLASVVIGNEPLQGLPVISQARAALVLHQAYWASRQGRLRHGALIAVDAAIADHLAPMPAQWLVRVPATQIAGQIGNPLAAGLVLLGGFAAMTCLVGIDSLVEAMRQIVPAYRREHLQTNDEALRRGAGSVTAGSWRVDLEGRLNLNSAA